MNSDKESAPAGILLLNAFTKNLNAFTKNINCKKPRNRKGWVKPWLQRRNSHRLHSQLLCKSHHFYSIKS